MKTANSEKLKSNIYPKDIFDKLEFSKVLDLLLAKCRSSLGQKLAQKTNIEINPSVIEKKLRQTHEFKQMLQFEAAEFPSENYLDLDEELKLLNVDNAVLTEQQIFRVYLVLQTVSAIVRYFSGTTNSTRQEVYPNIFHLCEPITVSKQLLNFIKDILDENGKVRSDASPELSRIRKTIHSLYRDLDRKFNAEIAEYRKNNWLADSTESIRNGHRVLAVLAEHKRRIRGIVHDVSATGNTIFIEPEGTMHISNEIVELQQAEKQEIYRLMSELTAKIRPFLPDIKNYQKLLSILDFIRAKALLAIDMNAFMPRLSTDRSVELFAARHPLLFLKNQALKKVTVPLTLQLNTAERILLVSGPNAGGKSVMLKTVGLLQLMFQAGMLVPCADHSIMSIFHNVFVDIGDEQSIENDLSTYSSKLKNMQYVTDYANGKTLVLIDEFGSGTDPALGGAIAESILEYLNRKFCYGIITTHYSNLKIFATQTKGIINGSMAFDYKNLVPLYKLELGKPGSSFAFELASKSGLNEQIIARAKTKVDRQYKEFDELLTTLQHEKQEAQETARTAEKRLAEANALIGTYSEKTSEFEKKRKQMMLDAQQKALEEVAELNRKFDKMVKDWQSNREDRTQVQKIKTEIQQDRQRLTQSIEILKDAIYFRDSKEPIKEGSFVRLRAGKEIGKVVELRRDVAIVEFGELRTNIKLKELVVVEEVQTQKTSRRSHEVYQNVEAKSAFDNTLDVRGMRREEALQAVESLVDNALVHNIDDLKIIHGMGDGILRRSIREMLKQYKDIKSVSDEEQQYGGAGVSLIVLG